MADNALFQSTLKFTQTSFGAEKPCKSGINQPCSFHVKRLIRDNGFDFARNLEGRFTSKMS